LRWRQEQSWTESKREGLSKMRMSDRSKENLGAYRLLTKIVKSGLLVREESELSR